MPSNPHNSAPPTVAIVGRPNVGKSSLFNRLIGKRKAIVDDAAGTTRDRLYALCDIKERVFRLVDTGGLDLRSGSAISAAVQKQVRAAMDEAQVLLFVCDGRDGIMPLEREIAGILRKTNKRIILAVNKVDDRNETAAAEFYELGVGEPVPVSAAQNWGIPRLSARLASIIEGTPSVIDESRIRLAIVGRPNVGKSSFLNALVKEERVIVNETPGTTRDSIDTYFETDKEKFVLIDTAGIRHKRKMHEPVEVFSLARSKESIRRADGCIIILDAQDGLNVDDLKIIELVMQEGRCAILCVNKWDLIKNISMRDYERSIRARAKFVDYIPVLFTSAITARNVYKAVDILNACVKNSSTRIGTHELNDILQQAQANYSPPHYKNIKPRLFYITQLDIKPPQFVIFANRPDCVAPSYLNYLEGQLRKRYNFTGTPIRFILRRT